MKRDKRVPVVPGSIYADVLSGYSLAFAASRRGIPCIDAAKELDEQIELHRTDPIRMRDIEGARLDRLLLALESGITAGDPSAIREARALSESKRKLYGLDTKSDTDASPVPITVSFSFASPAGIPVAGSVTGPASNDLGPASVSVGGDRNKNRQDDGAGDVGRGGDSGR